MARPLAAPGHRSGGASGRVARWLGLGGSLPSLGTLAATFAAGSLGARAAPWIWIPASLLLGIALVAARRLVLRRRCQAALRRSTAAEPLGPVVRSEPFAPLLVHVDTLRSREAAAGGEVAAVEVTVGQVDDDVAARRRAHDRDDGVAGILVGAGDGSDGEAALLLVTLRRITH